MNRERPLRGLGLAMVAAFVVLRSVNRYGDPLPWSAAAPISFLRCAKYPPSLDFLLMTLGPALLLLAWLDGRRLSPTHPLLVLGRVPLFFFLAHLFVIHALVVPFAWLRYGEAGFVFGPGPSPETYPAGYGYPLWLAYL